MIHKVRVPRDWLERGAYIEVEVPRNLRCAACHGGGCDVCDRSGAITLRGRSELPEIIQVTLPVRTGPKLDADVTLRIPEQGGLPQSPEQPIRGFLLLTVASALEADHSVRLADAPPPAPVPVILRGRAEPQAPVEAAQPESGVRPVRRRRVAVPIALALIVAWVAFLAYLRLSGRG